MRREIIQCEICKKEHDAQNPLPLTWVTLMQRECDDQHLCSGACLLLYAKQLMGEKLVLYPHGLVPPPMKMRRFLLVNEEKDVEGVRWSNGCVSIDPLGEYDLFYRSWEQFKEACDGSGIQWIDQEVSDGK